MTLIKMMYTHYFTQECQTVIQALIANIMMFGRDVYANKFLLKFR